MASLKRSKPMTLAGVGGDQSLSVTEPSPAGAILRPMKVEEIAEVVAKLPPDQLARFRRWFTAPTTPRSSTPLRPNLVASPAARSLN
jgi:hypothetical protein